MKLLKKSLACLLSVMLLLSCIPLSAAAAYTGSANDFTTSVTGGKISVVVKDINNNTSTGTDDLKSVLALALTRAQGTLSSLTLADIESLTVEGNVKLTQDDLDYIWNYAGTTLGTVASPGAATELTGLKVLDLTNAVLPTTTAIADNQFAVTGATASPTPTATLEEVYLPKSVATIGDSAFAGQVNLTTVNFDELENLTRIEDDAFNGAIFDTLDLSDKPLAYIGANAFETATTSTYDGITSVDLSGLTSASLTIGDEAFKGSEYLTEVNVTGSTNSNFVINIGSDAIFDTTISGNQVKIVIEKAKYDKFSTTVYEVSGSDWESVLDDGTVGGGTETAEFVHMSAPKNVTAIGTNDETVTVTWDAASYVDPAYTTAYYKVELFDSTGASVVVKTTPVVIGQTSYSLDVYDTYYKLTNYDVYSVEVSVYDSTTTDTGAVAIPDHDDYENEVLVVPLEAETVDITTDLTNKDHAFTENVAALATEVLPDVVIDIPANLIASLTTTTIGTYTVTDYGELKYQWYYSTSDVFDSSATALTGTDPLNVPYTDTITVTAGTTTATIDGVVPDTSALAPGVYYFYVVFTNTNPLAYDTAAQTTTTVTTWEKVRIRDDGDSAFPVITKEIVGATYILNEQSVPLEVEATSPDSGYLSYVWYYGTRLSAYSTATTSTTDPNKYGTTAFTGPATDKYGTFLYYVEVENDNPTKSNPEYKTSGPVEIIVKPEQPTVTDPADQSYDIGDTTTALSVTATVNSSGTLSYQWYQCDDANGTNPVPVGTDSDSYTPDASITAAGGTYYYYVEVINTDTDSYGTTDVSYTTTSAIARVTVDGTDAETPVLGTAVYGDVVITGTTATLEAPAVSGVTTGTISYQWYSCDADGSNAAPISGETGATYDPDTSVAGTYYYYVEVTNTDTTATGLQTVSVNSEVYTLTVVDPQADAETPVIDTDPADAEYETGETPDDLYIDVVAFTSPTVSLSYEWFSCDADGSNANLVGTGATYTPDTSAAGEYYYYVVITNTDSTATVNKTASATSGIAKITVTDPVPGVDAEEPVITTEPESAKYDVDDASVEALTVEANVTDGGTLSYQWYTCDADGTNSAPITGANSASYTPDVSAEGTTYYYVVVTNTNTSATGSQTAETKSEIVSVEVEDGYVAPVEYTVTFMDGEDELTDLAATVEEGEKVTKPADPEKEGYTFTGWYTDEDLTEAYDFDEPVTADLVLYAGWEAESTNHKPYVAGYDDGTFRPNASITRAEAAQMFYNILGYPDVDDVDGDYDGYPDVNDSGWYGAAVQVLSKMEVIKGDTDGNFRPNDSISRAEFSSMVQLFYELADGDATKMPFTDVGSTHWARTAIAAVYEANIVVGTNDAGTLFEPNEDITRAQAVSMLNKAQGRFTNEEMWDGVKIPFSDVTTAHWGWTQIMEAAVEHEHPAATETETDAEE